MQELKTEKQFSVEIGFEPEFEIMLNKLNKVFNFFDQVYICVDENSLCSKFYSAELVRYKADLVKEYANKIKFISKGDLEDISQNGKRQLTLFISELSGVGANELYDLILPATENSIVILVNPLPSNNHHNTGYSFIDIGNKYPISTETKILKHETNPKTKPRKIEESTVYFLVDQCNYNDLSEDKIRNAQNYTVNALSSEKEISRNIYKLPRYEESDEFPNEYRIKTKRFEGIEHIEAVCKNLNYKQKLIATVLSCVPDISLKTVDYFCRKLIKGYNKQELMYLITSQLFTISKDDKLRFNLADKDYSSDYLYLIPLDVSHKVITYIISTFLENDENSLNENSESFQKLNSIYQVFAQDFSNYQNQAAKPSSNNLSDLIESYKDKKARKLVIEDLEMLTFGV